MTNDVSTDSDAENPADRLDGILVGSPTLGNLIEEIPVSGAITSKGEGRLFDEQPLPHHLLAQQREKPQKQIHLLGR